MALASLPNSTEHLIPHKGRMKFIHAIEKFDNSEAETVLIVKDNIFLEKDGSIDPIVLGEFFAQLSAAHSGYESLLKQTENRLGFLVGIKDFQIFRNVQIDEALIVRIKLVNELHPFYFIEGEILTRTRQEEVAKGVIKVWRHGEEFNNIIKQTTWYKQPEREFEPSAITQPLLTKAGTLSQAIIECIYRLKYTAEQKEGTAALFFAPSFVGFDGHFPNLPILPGVVMVKTGKMMAEIMLQKSLRVLRLDNVKFNKVVFPEQLLQVYCKAETVEGNLQIQCKLSVEGASCSTFTITAV